DADKTGATGKTAVTDKTVNADKDVIDGKSAAAGKTADADKTAVTDKTAVDAKPKESDASSDSGEGSDSGKDSDKKVEDGKEPGKTTDAAPAKRGVLRRSLGLVGRGGRGVVAWAKRPSGRLILPTIVVILLIGLAGTAGAYLVPRALETAPTPSIAPTFGDAGAAPAPSASDPFGVPGGLPTTASNAFPVYTPPPTNGIGAPSNVIGAPTAGTSRPAEVLAAWAQVISAKVGIPVVAVQAYGYAELVTAQTTPTCHLTWTTLAAIGKVASGHGSSNGAVLGPDGVAVPAIFGLPLDGQGGRLLVKDTDQSRIDQDPTYDREVGPMKLTPGTWQAHSVDADRNGAADINDIDDAALAAATHLCKDAKGGVRDLSRADAWWDAVLNYNGGTLRTSAQKIFEAANTYGKDSRN
ncbi:hypothetical protein, partial [Actinoplanes regularis]